MKGAQRVAVVAVLRIRLPTQGFAAVGAVGQAFERITTLGGGRFLAPPSPRGADFLALREQLRRDERRMFAGQRHAFVLGLPQIEPVLEHLEHRVRREQALFVGRVPRFIVQLRHVVVRKGAYHDC
jgi:hypothetical protein